MSTLADAPYRTLLDEALEAWGYARDGVVAELRALAESGPEYRPADDMRTAGDLARHIAASGMMAAGELARPDGDFTRQSYDAFLHEYAGDVEGVRDLDGLVTLLEGAMEAHRRVLKAAGEIHMLQTILRFDGLPGTRLAWLNHAVDHESYHRGQLAHYVRLSGRTPALTRLIRGEE